MHKDVKIILRRSDRTARILRNGLSQDAVARLASEVVLRLVTSPARPALPGEIPPPAEIDGFCNMLIDPDPEPAGRAVQVLREKGAGIAAIYDGWFRSAAIRLGEMWESGEMSLVDVTIGCGRLYSLIRALGDGTVPPPRHPEGLVFASVPGEEHLIGLRMAAEVFRQEGWQVDLLLGLSHEDLVEALTRRSYQVLGLSASGLATSAALARLVVAVRIAQPGMRIMLSGRIVTDQPSFVRLLEADAVVSDLDAALQAVQALTGEGGAGD